MTLAARAASVLVVAIALVCTGCDELSARRLIQKGNEDYAEQRYEAAAAKFEAALAKAPDLDIGHHNLAITYTRMFKPGLETPENKAIADKAATHFAKWLEKHPDDQKILSLLTGLWIDAGDYPKAIDFWKKEHDKDPKSRDVIQRVAGIYYRAGDWRQAIEWYRKDIEVAPDVAGKVAGYQTISNLAFNKVFSHRDTVQGLDRTEIAEIGIEAAEAGIKLDPKAIPAWSIAVGLWNNHSIAHGPSWGGAIDRAEAQVFDQQARVLKDEAKKAQAAAGGAPGDPPVAPANGP